MQIKHNLCLQNPYNKVLPNFFLYRFYQRLMYEVDPFRGFWDVIKGKKKFSAGARKLKVFNPLSARAFF